MAKFKVRLKVQALELEIDGEREDLPLITNAVNRQFAAIVEPTEVIAELPKLPSSNGGGADDGKGKPPRRRQSSRTPADTAAPVEFRHDSGKFGSPVQGWTVLHRAIWLLYVLQNTTGNKEYSAAQLVATYNQQFKAAGKFHPPLLSRELARAKVAVPAPIGEDKGMWYLTAAEGERHAKELVSQALGQ